MADESDGIGEAFDSQLRVLLTIAAQFGEKISRLREELSRKHEAEAVKESRELQARFDAERSSARASFAPVQQSHWWDQATPEDIANVHETAIAWRAYDDQARQAGDRIRHEVKERYGIDVDAPGADSILLSTTLREAEIERAGVTRDRQKADEELTASQQLIVDANRHESESNDWANLDLDGADMAELDEPVAVDSAHVNAVEADDESQLSRDAGEAAYDSAERRNLFAASLEGKADQKTIDAWKVADSDQAKHPREAVTTRPGRASKTHRSGASTGQQRERGGLAR